MFQRVVLRFVHRFVKIDDKTCETHPVKSMIRKTASQNMANIFYFSYRKKALKTARMLAKKPFAARDVSNLFKFYHKNIVKYRYSSATWNSWLNLVHFGNWTTMGLISTSFSIIWLMLSLFSP